MSVYMPYNPFAVYPASNQSHASGEVNYNKTQNNSSIFSEFFHNANDNISSSAINSFKNDLTGLLNKYPNLRDNIQGLQGIYIDKGKKASTLNSFNLPSYATSAFAQNGVVGVYTPNTHQLIFEANEQGDMLKYFAHEFGHSIDYADTNNNGTSADNVSYNQYGSFSASQKFVNAFYADLKNLQGTNVAGRYPELAKELAYPLQEVNFQNLDGNSLTYHGVRETFALLASHIMTGEDQTSGIAQVMPNTYALAKEKVAKS